LKKSEKSIAVPISLSTFPFIAQVAIHVLGNRSFLAGSPESDLAGAFISESIFVGKRLFNPLEVVRL
jgi:hypothetical protein